jgi:hypothetical protein
MLNTQRQQNLTLLVLHNYYLLNMFKHGPFGAENVAIGSSIGTPRPVFNQDRCNIDTAKAKEVTKTNTKTNWPMFAIWKTGRNQDGMGRSTMGYQRCMLVRVPWEF